MGRGQCPHNSATAAVPKHVLENIDGATGRRGSLYTYAYSKSLYADVGSTDDVITIEGRVPHCGD